MRLFAALDHLWEDLAHHRSDATLRRWAVDEPVMGRFADLDDLVHTAQHAPTDARRDPALAALGRLARGDQTAQLTALRIMRPSLIRLERVYGHDLDWDDAQADSVARYLDVFVRTGSRPGAVLLRVRNDLARQRVKLRSVEKALGARVATDTLSVGPGPTERVEVLDLLRAAVERGQITPRDARIIVLTRLSGLRTDAAATSIGIHIATLRRARNRAEAALARHARAELEEDVA